jgi:hypothetical protein
MDLRIFIVSGIVTCAWIVVSYYHLAIQRGLPVGNFFMPENGKKFKLFAVIIIPYFMVNGAIDFGWYYFLVIPIASFALAFGLTSILGKHVQVLGVVGLVVLVVVNIISQIELVSP